MKSHSKGVRVFVAVAALSALSRLAGADPAPNPRTLTYPPLNPIHKVTPERFVMPNGSVVYLLENHDLPVVTGVVYFKASASAEAADKAGLASVTASTMRRGGTAAHPGDWLDDRLGAMGASINVGISSDNASAGVRCLAENTGEVISLLADVLRNPAFPEDKIELAKVTQRRLIAGRNDDMFSVLGRVASQTIYGKDSPWARTPEYVTVEAIHKADLESFHKLCFTPERAIFALYGDFKSVELKKLLAANFGTWKSTGVKLPELPSLPKNAPGRVVFAPKDDVTQTAVVLAQVGSRADDPDYAAVTVLENALGGGFQSRLFNHVRTQRGLAYATGATAGTDYSRPGTFYAYSLTRNDSALTALRLVRDDVEKAVREPFTDEEIKVARETALNSFVFEFASPDQTLFRSAYYELIGYRQDFLQTYQQALQTVTPASVWEAAKRKIKPAELQTIIIGREKDFEAPLSSLGQTVERFDITIPPPPSKLNVGAATSADKAQGQAWLKKAAELSGGPPTWAAVKSVHLEESATLSIQGQSIAMTTSASWDLVGGARLATQKLPFGEVVQGFDGTSGWVKSPQGLQDSPDAAQSSREESARSLFSLFGRGDKLELQALPDARTVEGVSYRAAVVKSDVIKDWVLLFAPGGELGGMEFQGKGPQGPAKETILYSDWKPLGGLKFPHSELLLLDGQKFLETKLTTGTLNAPMKPEMFKKPAS